MFLVLRMMPAALVHLFADFNIMLIIGEGIPLNIPAYYNQYTQTFNEHDKSISGWCCLEQGTHTGSFYVCNHEIVDHYLTLDMVTAKTICHKNAKCFSQEELHSSVWLTRQQQERSLLQKLKSYTA
ncbi:hypothetical protein C8R45DRAFT_927627 [Mycena sanguinolenta]|nr:hypothetical protein C8R45DRAFT_927627 [Mycena sanguinolenta]